ncbi:MAG: hypothetical protein AAFX54_12790 [Pseudomonadota bacterium]
MTLRSGFHNLPETAGQESFDLNDKSTAEQKSLAKEKDRLERIIARSSLAISGIAVCGIGASIYWGLESGDFSIASAEVGALILLVGAPSLLLFIRKGFFTACALALILTLNAGDVTLATVRGVSGYALSSIVMSGAMAAIAVRAAFAARALRRLKSTLYRRAG